MALNLRQRVIERLQNLPVIDKPIGGAGHQSLCNLPSIAEIEAKLAGELNTGSEVE